MNSKLWIPVPRACFLQPPVAPNSCARQFMVPIRVPLSLYSYLHVYCGPEVPGRKDKVVGTAMGKLIVTQSTTLDTHRSTGIDSSSVPCKVIWSLECTAGKVRTVEF